MRVYDRYPCDQCDYAATTASTLKQHKESKHEGVGYPCDQCDYIATTAREVTKNYLFISVLCMYISHTHTKISMIKPESGSPCIALIDDWKQVFNWERGSVISRPDEPTDRPTNQPSDMRFRREVTLPIRTINTELPCRNNEAVAAAFRRELLHRLRITILTISI